MADPVWRLVFDDDAKVVVRCTLPTVEAEAMLPALVPLFGSGRRADVVEALARLGPAFADSILSWTVEHPSGRPVPPTRKGVLRVPVEVLVVIVREWLAAWTARPAVSTVDDDPDLSLLDEGVPAIALVPAESDEDDTPDLVAAEAV